MVYIQSRHKVQTFMKNVDTEDVRPLPAVHLFGVDIFSVPALQQIHQQI